jgi:small conductance mechanosensitive channel
METEMEDFVPADVSAAALMAWTWAAEFLPRLATAIVLVIAGLVAASWLSRLVRRLAADNARLDRTMAPALAAIVRYSILTLIFVAVLGQLGVQTTSLLAALGAIGLAIGLAMQGTLSNIAAGFMLLWLRPFNVGEYVDNGTVAGTVTEIGLFATTLDTFDGLYRFVPNSDLWNSPLVNYTRNPTRMTDMAIGIAYDAEIARAREIMLELARSDQRVVAEPEPLVFLDDLGDSAVVLKYRVWIRTADYWPTQRHLIEETKRRFDAAGIEIPFPQRVVHMQGNGAPEKPSLAA